MAKGDVVDIARRGLSEVAFGGRSGDSMSDTVTPADFWRGTFGDEYTGRHPATDQELRARVALWAKILSHIAPEKPRTILEVGANIGNNLRALRSLSGARFMAVEPNDHARKKLDADEVVNAGDIRAGTAASIDFPDDIAEMTFSSGVLIHIPPADLLASCREIYRCSSRWIVAIEYFSAEPREVSYRGHAGKLFTRDFGGFYLDHFHDLKPIACGFVWKRLTGMDNLTYWVFSKGD